MPATSLAWPPWVIMWCIAVAVYVGCKLVTWWPVRQSGSSARVWIYLLAWPGLDAPTFLTQDSTLHPTWSEWLFAIGKFLLGLAIAGAAGTALDSPRLIRGWCGMVGVVFVLHFGLFHLLSCFWRRVGIQAPPLMDWPVLSSSVSDFWGRRWNRAFRDLTHRFLFRPLSRWSSPRTALVLSFLFSGFVHELAITVPARAGFGGPTLYFLIQAIGLLLERSGLGRRLGLGRGWRGRALAAAIVVVPVGLLFPRAFAEGIVVPFLEFCVSWSES